MNVAANRQLLDLRPPTGFVTILADPAWPSKSHTGKRTSWIKTNMAPRYKTMAATDILHLPINEIAAKDAVLVLWSTWMHLPLAMECIKAWGFRWATGFPWLKVCKGYDPGAGNAHRTLCRVTTNSRGGKMGAHWSVPGSHLCTHHGGKRLVSVIKPIYGPGPWVQHATEIVLIARRGHPFGSEGNPRPARKGLIIAPRQEHSRKPGELQDWIDAKFPGPKLEMFARERRKGWTSWGNELK